MKNLPIYILCTLVFFYCFIAMSFSLENKPSIHIAGADISHFVKYDGGYDVWGRLNGDFTIDAVDRTPSENEIEIFMQKIDFCSGDKKVVRTENDLQNLENIFFIGIETKEYADFYILFFDNFTKAITNASARMENFDINNPDVRLLSEYIYSIENHEFVKLFFINKGLYV